MTRTFKGGGGLNLHRSAIISFVFEVFSVRKFLSSPVVESCIQIPGTQHDGTITQVFLVMVGLTVAVCCELVFEYVGLDVLKTLEK